MSRCTVAIVAASLLLPFSDAAQADIISTEACQTLTYTGLQCKKGVAWAHFKEHSCGQSMSIASMGSAFAFQPTQSIGWNLREVEHKIGSIQKALAGESIIFVGKTRLYGTLNALKTAQQKLTAKFCLAPL